MKPPDTSGVGGAGVRIVLMPEEMKRGAGRLLDTAHSLTLPVIGCLSIPELGPGCGDVPGAIQSVQSTLKTQTHVLTSAASELQKRSFFAEIAGAMMAGYPLSSAQSATLMKYLHEKGSLKYAPKWERQKIGEFVGKKYAKTFHDPNAFVDLAKVLQANEADAGFSTGFVGAFGGKNLAEVPRVLQAMEYTDRMMNADPRDMVDMGLGANLAADGYELKDDPRTLLSTFAMALAIGTSSADKQGKNNPLTQAEDDLAGSNDHWAVAQLMSSDHVYGTRFLVQSFQHHVIPLIQQDATDYQMGAMPIGYHPIGLFHDHALNTDPKTIMLNALAHNGAASAEALSQPLDDKVFYQTPYGPTESNDPMQILYNAHWDDHGSAFSHVYTSAVDHLQPDGDANGTNVEANTLTAKLIQSVIHDPGYTAHDTMTVTLAHDLAAHQLPGMFESTSASDESSGGMMSNGRLYTSISDMTNVFQQIADNTDADKALLPQLSAYQAHELSHMAQHNPSGSYDAGYRVGAINQMLLNAHDAQGEIDYAHASEKQRLMFMTLKNTISALTTEVPGAGPIVGAGSDLFSGIGSPDHDKVLQANYDAKLHTAGSVKAMVATSYYDAGRLHDHGAPPHVFVQNGHLVDYSTLHQDPKTLQDPRVDFDNWTLHATGADSSYREAIEGVNDGLGGIAHNGSVHG